LNLLIRAPPAPVKGATKLELDAPEFQDHVVALLMQRGICFRDSGLVHTVM